MPGLSTRGRPGQSQSGDAPPARALTRRLHPAGTRAAVAFRDREETCSKQLPREYQWRPAGDTSGDKALSGAPTPPPFPWCLQGPRLKPATSAPSRVSRRCRASAWPPSQGSLAPVKLAAKGPALCPVPLQMTPASRLSSAPLLSTKLYWLGPSLPPRLQRLVPPTPWVGQAPFWLHRHPKPATGDLPRLKPSEQLKASWGHPRQDDVLTLARVTPRSCYV